jgi:hypothetical protein
MDLFGCGLKIKKEPGGLYSAEAFKFSPFLPWVTPKWVTSAPMSTDDLIRELLVLGFHQIDIGDAFQEADPDWLTKKSPIADASE